MVWWWSIDYIRSSLSLCWSYLIVRSRVSKCGSTSLIKVAHPLVLSIIGCLQFWMVLGDILVKGGNSLAFWIFWMVFFSHLCGSFSPFFLHLSFSFLYSDAISFLAAARLSPQWCFVHNGYNSKPPKLLVDLFIVEFFYEPSWSSFSNLFLEQNFL